MKTSRRLGVSLAWVLLPIALVAQTATFTWTGGAAKLSSSSGFASVSDGGNWVGGVAPTSADNALLVFGASTGLSDHAYLDVKFADSFATSGLVFNGPLPSYYLYSANGESGGTLHLGGSGITLNGSGSNSVTLNSTVELAASQTWTINDGTINGYSRITQSSPGTSLTKTGYGTLYLGNSDSDFSGGFTLQSGTLALGSSSILHTGDPAFITGPVGSGTLTLGDYTNLATYYSSGDITLHNAISLGDHVTVGSRESNNNLTLAGAITPQNTNTTLHLGAEGALFIQGGIANAEAGATTITFTNSYQGGDKLLATPVTNSSDSFPVAVLTGTNTYTGATIANNAGVIFFTPDALGQTNAISAFNGYVGTGYSGGMEAILAKITSPSTFDGALGFDTNPDTTSTPTTFADNVNLSSFVNDNGDPTSGFWGLGTFTSAILTGNITPPTGGNYVFGGGEGTLYVKSNLTAETGVRVRTPYGDKPITVYLQGANTFTGNVMSDHSIVVLDSATALPNGSGFSLDSGAYVGYTENFTAGGTGTSNADHTVTPAEFFARLANNTHNSDSIFGFDSANPNGRTITDDVNLGSFEDIFIGTTTHVHLQGAITAPSASRLSVTGINGGWLTIDSPLLADKVHSLNVGATNSNLHRHGYVELTSGSSTFAGGTTLNSGYLLLGASSTVDGTGAITQGPLGTGTVNVNSYYYWDSPATIAATTSGVTLHNNINFSYGMLQFGVPVTTDSEHPASKIQAYTGNGLTLNGNLSGTGSSIRFSGNGTFTLNGDNSGLFGHWIQIGSYYSDSSEGTPLVVANKDTSLGSSSNSIYLGSGADLKFTSAAPSIGNIDGGYTASSDTNRSFIALASGSTLTINQNNNSSYNSWLYANIGGTPADFSGTATAAVNASLVKTGYGNLVLAGDNTYSGTTTIKSGLLLAGSATAFGTSTIVLDGGGVGAANGFTLTNPIAFGTGGGTLGGTGAIASAITAGTNVTIAPGNSPGQLTFTSGLTFAGGGVASFDISNFAGGAGNGWDQIVVSGTGTFAITATTADPFTIQINSWSDIGNTLGVLTTDYSTPASLAILQASAPITNFLGDGKAGTSNLVLNTDNFTAYQPGAFTLSLSADSTALMLNFTPVPEPSTYALFGLGLLAIGGAAWRRHRSRQS